MLSGGKFVLPPTCIQESRVCPAVPGRDTCIRPGQTRSHSIRDRIASACLVEFPEPTTLPASLGAVRQVNRGTIVDSSDDEVPSLLGSTLWDSQTSNAIVGPTAETVHGQTVFGHPYLTIFGQSIFGQSIFGQRVLGPINFGQIQSNLGQSHFGQSIWI